MKVHKIKQSQRLPIGIDEAWDFLSDPRNLATITPDQLDFQIVSEIPEEMYTGQIIAYKIRPLLGIPQTWVTEITHTQKGLYFIDEQRIGPYKMWHHEHWLRRISEQETEISDQVHYIMPLGILGNLAHSIFVQSQLEGIFNYRRQKLVERFPLKAA